MYIYTYICIYMYVYITPHIMCIMFILLSLNMCYVYSHQIFCIVQNNFQQRLTRAQNNFIFSVTGGEIISKTDNKQINISNVKSQYQQYLQIILEKSKNQIGQEQKALMSPFV